MTTLGADLLRQIAPPVSGSKRNRQNEILQSVSPILQATLAKYGLDAPLRAAHFLAQTCVESDGFCTTEEYASGKAYEGRADLGNTEAGDGPRFKGRGLIQLTGRTNYQRYGKILHLDLIGDPGQAADPPACLLIACEYWASDNLSTFADWDDVLTITYRINGGFNGLDQRRLYLAKAKAALALPAAAAPDPPQPPLQRGDKGDRVMSLQIMLRRINDGGGVDGDFGPGTQNAVMEFQEANGLSVDGVVGAETWNALLQAASA